jgi:hypothetical protein
MIGKNFGKVCTFLKRLACLNLSANNGFDTWDLILGIWDLEFGTWNLELGI